MIDKANSIFLPFNTPSSKNNKEIGYFFLKPEVKSSWYIAKEKKGEPGKFEMKKIRPTLQSSDRTQLYVKKILPYILKYKPVFKKLVKDLPKPYIIQAHFVRDSKRKFDYINAMQVVADILSGHYWENDKRIPHAATKFIEDDDCDNLIIIPPLKPPFYTVDPKNPGVWLTVLDLYKSDVVELPLEETQGVCKVLDNIEEGFKVPATKKELKDFQDWQDIHSQILNKE